MEQITVRDINIDVVRKAIKNIHLAVYPPTGRVRIAAPIRTSEDAIRLFAISKLGWIKRHRRKFENQERISERVYKARESHYFLGRRYLLNVIEIDAPPRVAIRNNKYIDLYIRPGATRIKKHEIMNEWYRNELKKKVPALLEKWGKKLSVRVKECHVKLMKTKWGSCNTQERRIWINLELAKKPTHCLEYIVVHEMVHLLERHHNDRFIFYMDKYLPNWKSFKAELNKLPVSHAHWSY